MKYPMHILAVDAEVFRNHFNGWSTFTPTSRKQMHEAITNSLVLARREELEQNERYLQLLPYCVFWQRVEGAVRLFVYQRSKGQGEARLLGKCSIGVGGHMDFLDVRHMDGVIDVEQTLARSTWRELNEEILLRSANGDARSYGEYALGHQQASPVFQGLILDESDAVGRVHVGLVHTCEIDQGYEVLCHGDGMVEIGWHNGEELRRIESSMESWSKIVCQHLSAIEL